MEFLPGFHRILTFSHFPSPHLTFVCIIPYSDQSADMQEDVLNASALHFGYCAGDVVRFQILGGRLWVDFRTERESTGWYPMKNGPGTHLHVVLVK